MKLKCYVVIFHLSYVVRFDSLWLLGVILALFSVKNKSIMIRLKKKLLKLDKWLVKAKICLEMFIWQGPRTVQCSLNMSAEPGPFKNPQFML